MPGFRSHVMIHHPAVDFWNILQRMKAPLNGHGATVTAQTLVTPIQLASMTNVAHDTQLRIETDLVSSGDYGGMEPIVFVPDLSVETATECT